MVQIIGGMYMRYIVTGVDGKVCRRVAEEMLRQVDPHDLIFTCPDLEKLNTANRERWTDLGVSLREANYDDPDQMKKAFRGGDRILIISGLDIKKRVQQHKNAIDAAMAAGVQHITYPGIGDDGLGEEVYEENYVAPDHVATDAYLKSCAKNYGLRYTTVRPNFYLENYTTMYTMLAFMHGNKYYSTTSDTKATLVPKDDVGRAYAAVLLGKGEDYKTYQISGGEAVSVREIIQIVSEESGIDIEFIPCSKEEHVKKLAELNVPRFIEGDFSKSPVPFCAEDIITNDQFVEAGRCNIKSDVELLTGKKPLSVREVVKQSAYVWEQNITSWKDMK